MGWGPAPVLVAVTVLDRFLVILPVSSAQLSDTFSFSDGALHVLSRVPQVKRWMARGQQWIVDITESLLNCCLLYFRSNYTIITLAD